MDNKIKFLRCVFCHRLPAVRWLKSRTWHTSSVLTMQWRNHSIHWHAVILTSCFGFCRHTLVHISLSVSPSSQQRSQCLNLLFVMQVISEEGVSFKVSLFSRSLSFPQLLSCLCILFTFFFLWCDSVVILSVIICAFCNFAVCPAMALAL